MVQHSFSIQEEPASGIAPDDRRASVRHPATLQGWLRLTSDADGERWRIRVRDISTLGAGLAIAQRLEPGVLVEIDLESEDRVKLTSLLARVVYADEEKDGQWALGCAFVHELSNEALRPFQAERIRTTGCDSRRWVRFQCNVETVCFTAETAPGERVPARILNVSPGGIGILLPCQLAEGTLLRFAMPRDGGQAKLEMLVRVVRVQEHANGDWYLGCELVNLLCDEELDALLEC